MMDYKSMVTPMEANLKKLHDSAISSDRVDPTMYRQLIGSLLHLVNTRPDICYAVNTLSQHIDRAEASTLGSCQACAQISSRYHWIRSEIHF